MQNIPIRKHPHYRRPWIARPGNKLIVADWSAQEARIHAYLTQDEQLLDIFLSGKDPYIETARRVYGKEITKDDPYRDTMKASFLGATYGQTPYGLEIEYGIPLNEGEELFYTFWEGFPQSAEWCDGQRRKKKYVESVMGRRLWVNPYNNQHEKNNLNHPHQSTAADMMKLAIVTLHKNWKHGCPFGVVAPIHDEIILDVPEEFAEDIAEFVSTTMVEVAEKMCPGVPFEADAKIVDNWLEGK
jgi:DNA polymerase-1